MRASEKDALSKFIEDGRGRLKKAVDFEDKKIQIEVTIRQRYESQYARSGILQRFQLNRKIRREIREELDKLAPESALYLKS